ncbi:alpha/beta hydrolase [Halorarius litoreus]|uniref:alpha/beta hydrolase n=1 Tax=Halorarius litoreus TaxID=2962676 RepID=UPI0020CD3B2C|nr:alpha/beta fold hydrolase [Halorarius litoreus]
MQPTPATVESADGTELRLWELDPEADATEAVLYVHGSITCSRALFAPPVVRDGDSDDSHSWLAATARQGRAAFAVDIRGYGDSERPPELHEPPEANDPPVRAPLAAEDIQAAYDAVAARYDTVHLVGVSWGTMTGGYFAVHGDHDLASLTQCAPVYLPPWSFDDITTALNVDADLDAYYYQRYDAVSERQGGDDALFEAIWQTQVESNQGEDPETYIAQAGALADTKATVEGERIYDAAAIDCPTLVVRGDEDAISVREDAVGLFDELACRKEYAEIGGGDHYVMHGDSRAALYDAVDAFQSRV